MRSLRKNSPRISDGTKRRIVAGRFFVRNIGETSSIGERVDSMFVAFLNFLFWDEVVEDRL